MHAPGYTIEDEKKTMRGPRSDGRPLSVIDFGLSASIAIGIDAAAKWCGLVCVGNVN